MDKGWTRETEHRPESGCSEDSSPLCISVGGRIFSPCWSQSGLDFINIPHAMHIRGCSYTWAWDQESAAWGTGAQGSGSTAAPPALSLGELFELWDSVLLTGRVRQGNRLLRIEWGNRHVMRSQKRLAQGCWHRQSWPVLPGFSSIKGHIPSHSWVFLSQFSALGLLTLSFLCVFLRMSN